MLFLLQAAPVTSVLTADLSLDSYNQPFPDHVKAKVVQRQTASSPTSHLIIARGSLGPHGLGQLMFLVTKIIQANLGTALDAVVYPATIDNYGLSSSNETVAVTGDAEHFCAIFSEKLQSYCNSKSYHLPVPFNPHLYYTSRCF